MKIMIGSFAIALPIWLALGSLGMHVVKDDSCAARPMPVQCIEFNK